MNLYKYEKESYEKLPLQEEFFEPQVVQTPKKHVTIWSITKQAYNVLQDLVNTSTVANLLIPSAFILIGLGFIYIQFYPNIQEFFIDEENTLLQGTISPVQDEYIDLAAYISNPAGISELTAKAFESHVLQIDEVSQNYKGIFYISIPSIGLQRLPVLANVDSTSEKAYNTVLNSSLAHFRGTGLPISTVNNNIVIYGHSASTSYNPQVNDVQVAFSFLQNLKVGDEIMVEVDGTTYTYKMQKSKVVNPDDISIITGTKGKKTLTLFTCYPNGSNAYRYVAVARPV